MGTQRSAEQRTKQARPSFKSLGSNAIVCSVLSVLFDTHGPEKKQVTAEKDALDNKTDCSDLLTPQLLLPSFLDVRLQLLVALEVLRADKEPHHALKAALVRDRKAEFLNNAPGKLVHRIAIPRGGHPHVALEVEICTVAYQ